MTERQRQLLAAIINEFIETASAVGSVNLSDKYDFNVSPATIRNEMAALVEEGFLDKPHSSSGRIPTQKGLRYYIQKIVETEQVNEVDVVTKEEVKSRLNPVRFDRETLIREALRFLVSRSGNAAISLIGKEIYYAGLSEMLDIPEFQEVDNLKALMSVLEDYSKLSAIFNRKKSDDEVEVLIGKETGLENFEDYAVVFSELRMHGNRSGYISIVGPNRIDYSAVIPAVGFTARTLNRMAAGW